jgi:hypothetical protein
VHPGRTRSGLIEAARTAGVGTRRRQRHPGRTRSGLIEAVGETAPRHRLFLHPGRTRSGLIEALGSCRGDQGSASGHPGRTPPASLKQDVLHQRLAGPDKHPERTGPGLTEARVIGRRWDRLSSGIRGARAPASLKHIGLGGVRSLVAVAPGSNPGGLTNPVDSSCGVDAFRYPSGYPQLAGRTSALAAVARTMSAISRLADRLIERDRRYPSGAKRCSISAAASAAAALAPAS